MTVKTLILASASPQRSRLLRSLHVPFRVVASGVSERTPEASPRRVVLELALRKARAVVRRRPRSLVLGADTIVVCRCAVLAKPKDGPDALRMLKALNGRWHRVYTGVALVDAESGRHWQEATVTRVKARKLPPEALTRLAGRHLDKAGGYAMQDRRDPFIEKVLGPVDNVIGLPMASVRRLIRKAASRRAARGGTARTSSGAR